MANIILIGMMGCGKSTCGALLAQRLGRTFVDTDSEVERREGRTILEIFAGEGEDYFRQREEEVSQDLGAQDGLVIACGGGLPTRKDSMAHLKAEGTVIFLNRDPGEIYDSVSMSGRPLGQEGREAFLARFAQREPIYRGWADHVISSQPTPEETVEAILEVLK